ncbi:MAG: ABC transporter ATP-binding protein [SAR324 cluster bacterium]|nr:ABC transporter ATP-binding protein [SAR324 cluster bacterium]
MLGVKNLNAYYGRSHILQGVDLEIRDGEIVSLLGRNGVGRSTMCKAVMGLVKPHGTVKYKGENIAGLPSHAIAHKGIGYVPEDRWIFPSLTVLQNLQLGQKDLKKQSRWSLEDIYQLFPILEERSKLRAGLLSGGEQQMLTMCRTLMGDPDLIMIDEPTEGLAPKIVELVKNLISEIAKRGVSVLLVEQKLTIALKIANRLYVMGHGKIVFEGTPQEFQKNASVRKEWLEV